MILSNNADLGLIPRWVMIVCALILAISALLAAIAIIYILAKAGAEAVVAGGNFLPMWLVSLMVTSVGMLLSVDFFIFRWIAGQFGAVNKRIDGQFGALNKRVDGQFAAVNKRIDGQFGELRREFGDLRREFGALNKRVDGQFAAVNKLFAEQNKLFAAQNKLLEQALRQNMRQQGSDQ